MRSFKRAYSLILVLAILVCCMPVIGSATSNLDGKKIIAFGDSLTEGTLWWVNSNLDTYPDILQRNFPNSTVVNAGQRGDSTYNAILRYKSEVIAENPDIVLMCFGMNDQAWETNYNRPVQTLERYRVQLIEMIRACQEIGADVILVTPNPVYEEAYTPTQNNYEYGLMDEYCNEMREIALEYGCGLVDINYEIEQRGVSTYVSADGIHQTVAGHALYAECITNHLKAVYDGVNTVKATVNYKNENGDIIGSYEYVGAADAKITLATPSHIGCKALSEDIKTVLKDGDVFEMTFENEMIISRNKKYTTTAPNRGEGNSVNDDGMRLTDGIKSVFDPGTSFYSGWDPTETGFVEVTVDLGESKESNIYRVYGASGHWGISKLNNITVAVSDDGINFGSEIALSSEKVKVRDGGVIDGSATEMYSVTATPEQTQIARYVRFRIYGLPFVWIDEVEVIYNSDSATPSVKPEISKNIALNKKYETSQLFRSQKVSPWGWDENEAISYPDEGGISLTDGKKAPDNASYGATEFAGFHAKCPDYIENGYAFITVDLAEVYSIDKFVVNAGTVYNGEAGITIPSKIEIFVSNDKTDWGEAVASVIPADDSSVAATDIVITSEKAIEGRYIQFRIIGGGNWIMISEVEAYESEKENDADPETKLYALGDINMDETVNQYDYILAKRAHFNTVSLTEAQKLLGDMNNDAKNDQYDYILIKRIHFKNYSTDKTVEIALDDEI